MAWLHISTAARSAAADAIADLIDVGAGANGTLKIYTTGSGIPASPGTAISDQTLLSEHDFSATAFGAASAGVVTANAIADDTSANATGTASWARIFDADGTAVMDIDVGTSGATLILNTTSITALSTVSIDSGQFTMPSGA